MPRERVAAKQVRVAIDERALVAAAIVLRHALVDEATKATVTEVA